VLPCGVLRLAGRGQIRAIQEVTQIDINYSGKDWPILDGCFISPSSSFGVELWEIIFQHKL
jgi:hypothetical protein